AIERERSGAEARLAADRQRLDQVGAEGERLAAKRASLVEERLSLAADLETAKKELTQASGRCDSLESSINERMAHSESLSGDQLALTERLNEREQRHARLDSRRDTLVELIESRSSLDESVRTVLDAKANAPEGSMLSRLVAPLGELIEVSAEDAPAVEASLGAALQALVLDGTVHDAAELAAESLPGRITILPTLGLTESHAADTPEIAQLAPGHVTAVASLVHCQDELRPALERLLSGVMLVRDLDAAMLLAAGPLRGRLCRFVTRDGTVLEADGRILAGPAGRGEGGAGILVHRSELAELDDQLAALDGQLSQDKKELKALAGEAAAINAELHERRVELADAQRARNASENSRDRLTAQLERLDRDLPAIERDLASAAERRAAIETAREELAAKLEGLRRLADEQSAVVAQLEKSGEKLNTDAELATEEVSHARAETGAQRERLTACERELTQAKRERESQETARMRLVQEAEQREARIEEHRVVMSEAKSEEEGARAEAEQGKESLNDLSARMTEAADAVVKVAERLAAVRERATALDRDWQALEVSKREIEVRREHLEERSHQEISLDLAAEFWEYECVMVQGDVARIDQGEVGERIGELAGDIKKLGHVNLDAIEEEQDLVGRNEELAQQVEDIDAARDQLETLIERLADASRDRFKEVFTTIQNNFSGNDGMFRRLFGGGKAELRLLPVMKEDADGNKVEGDIDWLESGIEVIAKPPGKEPRSISQLSGGEKTMTAVALLMSIFQSKPSPFCVLDEVDAALDDANVERFTRIVRQFLDQCHFIVITHNKKTMATADVLFGITQQERGVSTRVPVRFDQVSANGEIKASVREPALGAAG
ncbi:MAG: hypothetical protein AAGB34_08280, partial [Planctomycetota bacterium]